MPCLGTVATSLAQPALTWPCCVCLWVGLHVAGYACGWVCTWLGVHVAGCAYGLDLYVAGSASGWVRMPPGLAKLRRVLKRCSRWLFNHHSPFATSLPTPHPEHLCAQCSNGCCRAALLSTTLCCCRVLEGPCTCSSSVGPLLLSPAALRYFSPTAPSAVRPRLAP